jgi:hypothetical protein
MAEISIVRQIYVRLSGLGLMYCRDVRPHCLTASFFRSRWSQAAINLFGTANSAPVASLNPA